MSSLSWLAYSEAERKRTLDVLHMLGDQETRDELGIGRVRDALSDLLFPGTSTIQTRARYLLFIPWIYAELESKSPVSDAAGKARRWELRLIEALLKGSEEEQADDAGIIGRQARQTLATLPSAIYWQGLQAWGIRRYPGQRRSYHHLLSTTDVRHFELDDDLELAAGSLGPSWDLGLPEAPHGFLESATLELRREEAEYLHERVTTNHPTSALVELLSTGEDLMDLEYPWMLAAGPDNPFSEQNRHYLEHGELFSLGMHGASLLYNLMLARAAERPQVAEDYEGWLDEWFAELEVNRARLETWARDLEALWQTVRIVNPRAPGRREGDFIESWIVLALGPDGQDVASSERAQTLVADREWQLKRSNSRLRSPSALEAWGGASGSDRLSFRWGVARRLVGDISLALQPTAPPAGVSTGA